MHVVGQDLNGELTVYAVWDICGEASNKMSMIVIQVKD